jgi:mono/diheme cytochrome c family protein
LTCVKSGNAMLAIEIQRVEGDESMRFSGLIGLLLLTALPSAAQSPSKDAAIRGGLTVANTICIACHVVSPNQRIKPIYRDPLPSFQDIANQPGTTAESLRRRMSDAAWHAYAVPRNLTPMARISEKDRAQVIEFILSLKKPQDEASHRSEPAAPAR